MPDVEDEIIVAAHVIKALIEKLYRAAKERRNDKVQEDMKNILEGFTKELQKGVDTREELKSLLDKQKDEFLKVKKEMGISDEKKLDTVLDNAKEKVREKTQSRLKKEFVFGKYDANVIFKEFRQNKLTEDALKVRLMKRYSDLEEATEQYDIYMARINKLIKHGYVAKDEGGTYSVTPEGLVKADEVRQKFKFTMYDVDVVFKYIENAQGSLSNQALKEQLDKEYTDEEYSDKQLKYLTKRLDDNCTLGTVSKSDDGSYSITDEGKTKALALKESKENTQDKIQKKDLGRNKKPSR